MKSLMLMAVLLLVSVLAGCSGDNSTNDDPDNTTAPVLTTASVSAITETTAQGGGTITSDGGATVTARGVCWSTNATPTVANDKTNNGTGVGSFSSSITGLSAGMTFNVRAYATNSAGTGYGSAMLFTTTGTLGPVTDIDGNTYQVVRIGNQWWMAENLEVTHYRNGDAIPIVTDDTIWGGLTTGAYCEYDNDVNNVATYGRLYNGYAVNDSRNIAPAGWHVPTDAEWKQLEMYLGMSQVQADSIRFRGTDEGGKLKEVGTTHWAGPNTGATNTSGFSGLPGGYRVGFVNPSNALYTDVGTQTGFWSSTKSGTGISSQARGLHYWDSRVLRGAQLWRYGSSVRCVKD